METREQAVRTGRRAGAYLAADLSMWVARETLANLALSVVQTVEESRLRSAVACFECATLPRRMMLALLTFSYATGVCGSQAVADKIGEEPVMQYLCAGRRPSAEEIRRFRNHNRELIAQCLDVVCLVVWRIRFGAWRSGESTSGRRLLGGSVRFDPLVQIELKCEVMERLNRAEMEDGARFRASNLAA